MKVEMQNKLGIRILLEQAVVARIDAALRSPSGELIESSETAPLLRVDAAFVESVRKRRGALNMTFTLDNEELLFGVLVMRSEDHLALLLYDSARQDVVGWLDAAVQQGYLPVVLAAGERAIQVRLPFDDRLRGIRDLARHRQAADAEQHCSAFMAVLDLLENPKFLHELSVEPGTVRTASFFVLGSLDASGMTAEQRAEAEPTGSMH
jgi:hypothetical protein